MNTHTSAPPHTRCFVDPEQLHCPGCGAQVRCAPPTGLSAEGMPVPEFSHPDATPLCRRADGTLADPIELPAVQVVAQ
jgi:hypothetical protein